MGVFVAWSRLSRRTVDLAERVGLDVLFIKDGPPYLRAWLETGRLLSAKRPGLVFAQLPQGPLLARLVLLRGRLGFRLVTDVHSGFLVYGSIAGRLLNRPFRGLLRSADLVLAHNEPVKRLLLRAGVDPARVLVVYDPVPRPRAAARKPGVDVDPLKYILLPAGWAPDEPMELIARAFESSGLASEGYKLVVTGDYRRRRGLARRLMRVPGVVLTGYLPRSEYEWLLANAGLVLAITTREYTVLSALWEAVAYDRPVVVSATRTLTSLLGGDYPCLAPLTVRGLADALAGCTTGFTAGRWYRRLRARSEESLRKLRETLEGL